MREDPFCHVHHFVTVTVRKCSHDLVYDILGIFGANHFKSRDGAQLLLLIVGVRNLNGNTWARTGLGG
jgi:hypothetical protein